MKKLRPFKVGEVGHYKRYVVKWWTIVSSIRKEEFISKDSAEHFYNILKLNDYDCELFEEVVQTTCLQKYNLNLLKREDL